MNKYRSGTLVRVAAVFSDDSGAADPTTVTCKYRAGENGAVQSAAFIKDSVGNYHYDIDTSGWLGPGVQQWDYEFTGTGTVQVSGASAFAVEPAW